MLKATTKKTLILFFVIAILTPLKTISPMKQMEQTTCIDNKNIPKAPHTSDYSPSKTTFRNISPDSLHRILQFSATPDDGRNTFELRKVNRKFRDVIDSYPCFLTHIDGNLHFLHYPNNGKKNFQIHLNLPDTKKQTKLMAQYLKKLIPRLGTNNENKLKQLKIKWNGTHGYIDTSGYKKSNQVNKLLISKNSINNEKLNMFGDIEQSLTIHDSKNFGSSNLFWWNRLLHSLRGTTQIKWPGKFKNLTISKCPNFNLINLKNLPYLENLQIVWRDKFGCNKLNKTNLESLQKISVKYCEEFCAKGLNKLTNVHGLTLDDYGEFLGDPQKEFKNLRKFELDFSSKIPLEIADKKAYKILKKLGGLNNLRKLTVFRRYPSLKNPDIIEALQQLRNKKCEINLLNVKT